MEARIGIRMEVEQDGPRYRWVFMFGERRMAKGAHWWNTEEEAHEDSERFLLALGQIAKDEA